MPIRSMSASCRRRAKCFVIRSAGFCKRRDLFDNHLLVAHEVLQPQESRVEVLHAAYAAPEAECLGTRRIHIGNDL
eukprot:9853935-Heterocapsa_arctica.AAC.1